MFWDALSIDAAGGWQNWTTVSVPDTLGAGVQQLTLLFDTESVNPGDGGELTGERSEPGILPRGAPSLYSRGRLADVSRVRGADAP